MNIVISDLVKALGTIWSSTASLQKSKGSITCFMGPSGCGKTTHQHSNGAFKRGSTQQGFHTQASVSKDSSVEL